MAFITKDSSTRENAPDWPSLLLALMMVMVPSMGVPSEELLQDTLKSILVALFSLSAAFMYFWSLRSRTAQIHGSRLLLLPLGLMAYALYSAAWSHAYLASVEAIRWLVFSIIIFLGINTFTRDKTERMTWGIHLGATVACLWAACQFWFDFALFPQGPAPASTFVNRNFFAEYIVCALPFSVLLAINARTKRQAALINLTIAFNITALMMTGTRSALATLLIVTVLLSLVLLVVRREIASGAWGRGQIAALATLLVTAIMGLGSIPSSNASIAAELGHNIKALERSRSRTATIVEESEYTRGSMSVRAEMWLSTARMIQAHPLLGVGAGAWEVQIPRYQDERRQLETDYYAHNEFLQLVSEYGVIGWAFLVGLGLYLFTAMRRTLRMALHGDTGEVALRACALTSLVALLLVSCFGFPWRLAGSGSLFAVALAILAASDLRLRTVSQESPSSLPWRSSFANPALMVTTIATLVAMFICWQAIVCESKLTRSLKLALTISQSRDPHSPHWEPVKTQMIELVRQGVAINPHYRKLTPSIADALAGWGDWSNANWIWQSVLESRPYVVVILTNLARGHLHTDDLAGAQAYYQRAKQLQPNATLVRNMEVLLLSRSGKRQEANALATELLRSGNFDYETLRLSYFIGIESRDWTLSALAQELRLRDWPAEAVDAWLKLGNIHANAGAEHDGKAIESYRAAVNAAPAAQRSAVLAAIPERYRTKVQ